MNYDSIVYSSKNCQVSALLLSREWWELQIIAVFECTSVDQLSYFAEKVGLEYGCNLTFCEVIVVSTIFARRRHLSRQSNARNFRGVAKYCCFWCSWYQETCENYTIASVSLKKILQRLKSFWRIVWNINHYFSVFILVQNPK